MMKKVECLKRIYNKLTGQTSSGDSICDVLHDIGDNLEGVLAGKASLVNGKVPSAQLPSYVDDVIEGYYYNSKFYSDSEHETEITGETGKIYVDLTSNNTYRWGGSAYTEVSAGTQLPTVVNNKYLHTNASTGALEWADVSGGAEVFIADYGVTTYGELRSAYIDGKILYLRTSASTTGIYQRYVLPLDVNCWQDSASNMNLIFRAHFIDYDANYAANNSLRIHEFSIGSSDGTSFTWSYRRGDMAITAAPVVGN